jgi:hypothetical protein
MILHFNFPFHHISKGLFLLTSFYSPPSIYFFHVKKVLHMDVFGDVQPTWGSLGQFFNGHKFFKVFNNWWKSLWVCYGTCNVENPFNFYIRSNNPNNLFGNKDIASFVPSMVLKHHIYSFFVTFLVLNWNNYYYYKMWV